MKVKTFLSSSFLCWKQGSWVWTFGETYTLQSLTPFPIPVDSALEDGLVSFTSWQELLICLYSDFIPYENSFVTLWEHAILPAMVTHQLPKAALLHEATVSPWSASCSDLSVSTQGGCCFSTPQWPHCNLIMLPGIQTESHCSLALGTFHCCFQVLLQRKPHPT